MAASNSREELEAELSLQAFGPRAHALDALHPDLQPHVEIGQDESVVRVNHRLYAGPLWLSLDEQLAHLNAMYESKRAGVQELVRRGQHEHALQLIAPPHRLAVLAEWSAAGLAVERLRVLLPVAWLDCETPHELGDAPLTLFLLAGYCADTLDRLEEPTTIYRGQDRHTRVGISWTTDRMQAFWHANRCLTLAPLYSPPSGVPTILTATVTPEQVLARFESRGESELIVDPATLTEIHTEEP